MQRQAPRILTLLAPKDLPAVEAALRALTQTSAGVPQQPPPDMTSLVRELVTLTDDNFDERYRVFYEEMKAKAARILE